MKTTLFFILAAVFEIAGCYATWMWLKMDRSAWWLVPGTVSLVLFAAALTRIDSVLAGRAYAAYGGVYIASSLVWMMMIEQTKPTWTDLAGAAVCLAGAALIIAGARQTVAGV